jgi:xylan 1,4-beta-xylosidase
LFAKLGRTRVAVDAPAMVPVDRIVADSVRGEPDIGAIASLDDQKSRLTVLLWNYHDVAGGYEDPREVELTIEGLSRAALGKRAVEYSIDERSGNAYTAWLAMGSTQSPSAEQISQLHAAAKMRPVPRDITRSTQGPARLRLDLPRQSVKLIEIPLTPVSPASR